MSATPVRFAATRLDIRRGSYAPITCQITRLLQWGPATRYDAFAPSAGALDWRRAGSTCSGATRSRWNERGEIMHRPVRFADDIEPLVQFVEETEPSRILEATLGKLRDGLSLKTMLTASALAVTRSSDLPPGHHGGPLHPLVGLHAVHHLVERLDGEQRFLPVLQHVALSNKHIHHPAMGPYALLEFEPMDEGGVEATKDAFFAAVNRGESNKADHYFLWLWDHMLPVEALDILLTVAIPKNVLDDHYFIFPA